MTWDDNGVVVPSGIYTVTVNATVVSEGQTLTGSATTTVTVQSSTFGSHYIVWVHGYADQGTYISTQGPSLKRAASR